MIVQYFLWVQHLVQGNFGLSLEYQRPNADLIGEQIGLTLALALFSFVLTWAIAIPAGIYSATHPRSIGDHILTVVNYVGVATPNFMLALILMWVAFAYFDLERHRPLFARVRRRAVELGQASGTCWPISGCRHWCWASPAPRASAASCAPTFWTSSTSPMS